MSAVSVTRDIIWIPPKPTASIIQKELLDVENTHPKLNVLNAMINTIKTQIHVLYCNLLKLLPIVMHMIVVKIVSSVPLGSIWMAIHALQLRHSIVWLCKMKILVKHVYPINMGWRWKAHSLIVFLKIYQIVLWVLMLILFSVYNVLLDSM